VSSSYRTWITAVITAIAPAVAVAQSSVAVSPFVSYVPSAETNPLAGMSLTFGGTTGLALRGGADLSLSNPRADGTGTAGGSRPWGADADVVLFLNGLGGGATMFSHTLAPYLFSGISMVGGDSLGTNVVHNGWSYGAGATIPLGLDADVFGEARWRMPQYVLPTAKGSPSSKSELRVGLSFHVGGSEPPRRRRSRYADDYDDDAPAPAVVAVPPTVIQAPPPTVIVTQPAPQTVIVTQPEQQPERVTNINVNLPGSINVWRRHRRGYQPSQVVQQSRLIVRRVTPVVVETRRRQDDERR
jgi:hypothetical protein